MTKKPYLQARGEEWDKARMRAFVRDDFTCQWQRFGLKPEADCTTEYPVTKLRRLIVHHIEERQNGGSHDLSNLITLCAAHHVQVHPHLRFEYAAQDKVLDAPPDREL